MTFFDSFQSHSWMRRILLGFCGHLTSVAEAANTANIRCSLTS